jgi:hypothetical protein
VYVCALRQRLLARGWCLPACLHACLPACLHGVVQLHSMHWFAHHHHHHHCYCLLPLLLILPLLLLLLLLQVWSLREPPSPRLVLQVRANVCSLEYHPSSAHLLAVGSAGHVVR